MEKATRAKFSTHFYNFGYMIFFIFFFPIRTNTSRDVINFICFFFFWEREGTSYTFNVSSILYLPLKFFLSWTICSMSNHKTFSRWSFCSCSGSLCPNGALALRADCWFLLSSHWHLYVFPVIWQLPVSKILITQT